MHYCVSPRLKRKKRRPEMNFFLSELDAQPEVIFHSEVAMTSTVMLHLTKTRNRRFGENFGDA